MKNKKKVSFILKTTAVLSVLILLFNKLTFTLATMKERLFSTNKNYFNWRFGNIFYTVHGSGSPILLVHDLNCSSSSYEWHKVIDSLSQNHTVYCIDLLGCGRSDKPKITYTNYLYVQLINDFIKTVIKRKTTIMITGKSCPIAVMSCYIEPEQFDNIILINPEDIALKTKYPTKLKKLVKYFIETPVLGTFIYNLTTCRGTLTSYFNKKVFCHSYKTRKRLVEAYCESAHLGGSSAKYLLSSMQAHYTNINIQHAIKQLNNNIYIIMGEKEMNQSDIIRSYIEINPSIEADIINDAKHLPQLECPDYFLSICEIYL